MPVWGTFRWPRNGDDICHLTPDELYWLVRDVESQQVKVVGVKQPG
ncbi:hypothetical protein BN128_951 [Cronobacter sakazakii 696]|nr:hypothetical protein BN128_951 [Cronobacter sakazakii 696]